MYLLSEKLIFTIPRKTLKSDKWPCIERPPACQEGKWPSLDMEPTRLWQFFEPLPPALLALAALFVFAASLADRAHRRHRDRAGPRRQRDVASERLCR